MLPILQLSPNHSERLEPISLIILHYTGMPSGAEALARLCDPASQVSAHYLIEEDGSLYQLVADNRRAWHAGISSWQGERDVNSISIGIELVNPGHEFGYRPFPKIQMECLTQVLTELCARHNITPCNVIGHSDVAPERKQDPGELFDWAWLAQAGFGIWPKDDFKISPQAPALISGSSGAAVLNLQIALGAIGYGIEGTGLYDPLTEAVVRAFQRHFQPHQVTGNADKETISLIHYLAGRGQYT